MMAARWSGEVRHSMLVFSCTCQPAGRAKRKKRPAVRWIAPGPATLAGIRHGHGHRLRRLLRVAGTERRRTMKRKVHETRIQIPLTVCQAADYLAWTRFRPRKMARVTPP